MMRSLTRVALATCALVAVLAFGVLGAQTAAASAQAANQNTSVVIVPISVQAFNFCNGETVFLSGSAKLVVVETASAGGTFHLTNQINYQDVTGIGNMGNTYHAISVLASSSTVDSPLPFIETQEQTITLISSGGAPNFDTHALFHLTINPDDTLTAFVDNFTFACKG